MIRVLQIVTHMNRGGLETMLMNYYRHIDREQIQFDFLVHRKERADYDDEIESLGGHIYRLSNLNPFSKKYKEELRIFFRNHKYQVVHSHLDCMSAVPLRMAKKAGVKVCIAHSHNSSQDHNLKYLLKLYYKKKIPKYADKLFACSTEAGDWMFKKHKYEVLANAIDAEKFRYNKDIRKEKRREWNIGDEVLLGHVGRFNPQKNHEYLIDIFAAFHKVKPLSKLILIGTGDGEEAIKNKVEKAGLTDSVIFAGLRSDIPELMSAMDAFVFPSLYEGLPVTMVEAQASGLQCFISDKVPIECKKTDLVHQIKLEKKPEIWAKYILKYINYKRRNTFQEICQAGFDIQENAKKLQEFYLKAEKGETDLCLH